MQLRWWICGALLLACLISFRLRSGSIGCRIFSHQFQRWYLAPDAAKAIDFSMQGISNDTKTVRSAKPDFEGLLGMNHNYLQRSFHKNALLA